MDLKEELKINGDIDLPSETVINLMYTSRWLEEQMSYVLKEYDLTIPQFNVLRILRGQKGKPASLSCIQERMVDKNSNTTRLVDKLIKKELTSRRICPDNRRKVEIELTDKGQHLLSQLDPVTENKNVAMTAKLATDELKTLNELLNRLRET